jgi:hypothetical protein
MRPYKFLHKFQVSQSLILSFLSRHFSVINPVVTPAYCLALFGGLRATYICCGDNGGAEVRGWGSSVKAK